MAKITINEISENYTYSVSTSSFATVALPITSSWGPGWFGDANNNPVPSEADQCVMYSNTTWDKFASTRLGLEGFVAAYRGPSTSYQAALDYSYQIALTLLATGYDVLVCRLCPGKNSEGTLKAYKYANVTYTEESGKSIKIKAIYPGTFGDKIHVELKRPVGVGVKPGWYNLITFLQDASGVRTTLENVPLSFVFENATESRMYYKELESKYIGSVTLTGLAEEDLRSTDYYFGGSVTSDKKALKPLRLTGGADDGYEGSTTAVNLAKARYEGLAKVAWPDVNWDDTGYKTEVSKTISDTNKAKMLKYREWLFTAATGNSIYRPDSAGDFEGVDNGVYQLLKDKLNYNPNRIISPWDDQDLFWINNVMVPSSADYTTYSVKINTISPIHVRLMDVAFYSRCATSMLDIPRSLSRCDVYKEPVNDPGYAQKLARNALLNNIYTTSSSPGLFPTHSALFAPWGQYRYSGTGRMHIAPPSFLALMIQYAQIKNQSEQYEWILPRNRKHNLNIGKMDYTVPKKLLDQWQKLEGVGINVITKLPELGTNIWGNSTLFEVPEGTYQALANLSTRYLVNAVEDTAYRSGLSITFQYNNDQAYNQFYAGVTPLLDTMKNVGAIEDYRVQMAADINGLDQVNANSVIGQIILIVNGVINDITVDLVALPPSANIDDFVI